MPFLAPASSSFLASSDVSGLFILLKVPVPLANQLPPAHPLPAIGGREHRILPSLIYWKGRRHALRRAWVSMQHQTRFCCIAFPCTGLFLLPGIQRCLASLLPFESFSSIGQSVSASTLPSRYWLPRALCSPFPHSFERPAARIAASVGVHAASGLILCFIAYPCSSLFLLPGIQQCLTSFLPFESSSSIGQSVAASTPLPAFGFRELANSKRK